MLKTRNYLAIAVMVGCLGGNQAKPPEKPEANPLEVLSNASRYLRRMHGRKITRPERKELWWAQKKLVGEFIGELK